MTVHDISVASNLSVAGAALFVAPYQEGDSTISHYGFWDDSSGGGHFTLDGAAQAAGQWIFVSAANLGAVRYIAPPAKQNETLFISVSDGLVWSDPIGLTL